MGRLKVVPSSQEEKEAYDAAMSAITFEDKPVELKCRIKCIGGVHKGAMGSVYKITACYYKFKDDDGNNKMVSKKYGRRIKASVVSSAANKKRRVHLIVDDEKQGRSSVYMLDKQFASIFRLCRIARSSTTMFIDLLLA